MDTCKICGRCCILYPIVPLSKQEAESELYDIGRRVHGVSYLGTKWAKIPELKRKAIVCVYYDPHTQLCFMHGDNKPIVCKARHCGGSRLVGEWLLLKRAKMSLVSEVFE